MFHTRSRQFWAAAFAAHFLAVGAVSCWDIANLVTDRRTILPQAFVYGASRAVQMMKSSSPRQLPRPNLLRQIVIGYCHAAGIDSPYTFFAPNVPESLKIVFEIQFPDKRVSYELPKVQSDTEGLRLSALIDQAAANPGPWREVILQMLAARAADNNPEATRIRVVVAALKFPRPDDFLKGSDPEYDFVCGYDFIPAEARVPD